MGAIQHRPDRPKPWRAYYRALDGRQISRSFGRKADAEKWLATETADIVRGEWIDPRLGRITVGEWALQFTGSRVHVRPSTRARDESVMSNHVLRQFGDRRLVSVTTAEVESWVAELVAAGYAPNTVRKAYQLLSGLLSSAVRSGVIARTPCSGIKLPKPERHEMRFLTPAEVEELAQVVDPAFRMLVITAAFTGVRFGEAAALRVAGLDPLRRSLTVSETLSEVRGELRFGPPKTTAARRTLAVPRFVAEDLAASVAGRQSEDLVFVGPEGGPLRRTNFRRRFWQPAVRASVGEPCRFHDLRHTHVAMLIGQGEHPKVIAARLGHSSVRTVLDIYGHLYEGLDEAAAQRLEQTWEDSRAAQMLPKRQSAVVELPSR